MQIQLVSHASVLIRTADLQIWTDPWLTSKVFNNSWTLLLPPAWDPEWLDAIDYIWISHEHPDHFNIPTLKALPDAFKRRVTVLFQANNSDKMFAALRRLGFKNTLALPHRQILALAGRTRVYCHQIGQMDSCLAVLGDDTVVLDINDAEADTQDCQRMRADLGPVRIVLNQFSLAGYGGEHDRDARLPAKARQIIDNMINNHRDLGAEVTIPIASFVYFSSVDNAYMNAYANTPRDVADAFAAAGQQLAVLDHGDTFDAVEHAAEPQASAHQGRTPREAHDSEPALRHYDQVYAGLAQLPLDPVPPASLADISAALSKLHAQLTACYPPWLLATWLRPVTIKLLDLDETIELDLARGQLRRTPCAAPDLSLHAQPLLFALQHPFGVQTLGVSARLTVHANAANWRRHRILLSMFNAELYLRPHLLLTRRNLEHLRARFGGGLRQLTAQIARMR